MIFNVIPLIFVALVAATEGQLLCYYCEDCSSSDPVIEPCGFARLSQTTPALTLPPNGGGGINTLYPQYPSDGVQNPILTTQLPPLWNDGGGVNTLYPQYPSDGLQNPILTTQLPPLWNDGSNTLYPQYPSNVQNPILTTQTPPLWNNGGINNGAVIITTLWPGLGSVVGSNNGGVLTTIWPGMGSSQIVNGGTINGGGLLTTIWPGQWMPAKRDVEPNNTDGYACVTVQSTVGNRQVIDRGCARKGRSSIETCNGVTKGNVQSCKTCNSPLCNNEK